MVCRLGLMLPGAVSLGAYEAGAVAALATAVQHSEGQIVIDAIASASAGSMTALVAARSLLCGDDPTGIMTAAWVDLPDITKLKTKDPAAPLTMDELVTTATTLLGAQVAVGRPRQLEAVRLSMALTALGGLTYALAQLVDPTDPNSASQTLLATTYLDFFSTVLPAGAAPEAFTSIIAEAMASGANPLGFAPRMIDRSEDRSGYQSNGIVAPDDEPLVLWYSDGGDVDNQPLGRLLDLIDDIEEVEDDTREIVVLQIDPPSMPAWTGTWFGDHPAPSWLDTLFRVAHCISSQSLYDDLRTLEKTNRRIAWIRRTAQTLERSSDPGAVRDAAASLASSKAAMRAQVRSATGTEAHGAAAPATPASDLEGLLLEAAGLEGKREIKVEVISPLVGPYGTVPAAQQLDGEFFGHFGGFLDRRFREHDFVLGFMNARAWLGPWLASHVERPDAIVAALDAVVLPAYNPAEGGEGLAALTLREKLDTVEVLLHTGDVIADDVVREVTDHLGSGPIMRAVDRVLRIVHLRRAMPPGTAAHGALRR